MRCFVVVITLVCSVLAGSSLKSPRDNMPDSSYDQYIIKIKNSVSKADAVKLGHLPNYWPTHTYFMPGFQGFATYLSAPQIAQLMATGQIDYIEKDAIMETASLSTQYSAPWGLSRLSSHKPGNTEFTYDDSAGEGTCVYIIDTGIDANHIDFEGRATFLVDTRGPNVEIIDEDIHGTSVAGIIGSKTYGVAKKTQLYAVKVMARRSGTRISSILDGIMYVANNRTQDCPNGSVVNISFDAFAEVRSILDAGKALVDADLFVTGSAGNGGARLDLAPPESRDGVCLVGSINKDDAIASYSNYGPRVDIFAPGAPTQTVGTNNERINWPGSDGTSFASAYVAGLGAYLLGQGHMPYDLCGYIKRTATRNVITGLSNDTANLLAYTGNLPFKSRLRTRRDHGA